MHEVSVGSGIAIALPIERLVVLGHGFLELGQPLGRRGVDGVVVGLCCYTTDITSSAPVHMLRMSCADQTEAIYALKTGFTVGPELVTSVRLLGNVHLGRPPAVHIFLDAVGDVFIQGLLLIEILNSPNDGFIRNGTIPVVP